MRFLNIISKFKGYNFKFPENVKIENVKREEFKKICRDLIQNKNAHFSGIIADKELYYLFLLKEEKTLHILKTDFKENFISISDIIHASEWYEREIEDLFGVSFEGHPKLGNFILHDEVWPENVSPMRKDFDYSKIKNKMYKREIKPKKIVDIDGSFIMPVGPVFSGEDEAVHFQIETIGEEIIRVYPKLFYKFRAVEKLAENRNFDEGLLLIERFAGINSFSHAFGYCLGCEKIFEINVPERARLLRIFLAEFERIRHHIYVLERLCASTALSVATSQFAILEERLLRLSCELTGHRYMFSIIKVGGLREDIPNEKLKKVLNETSYIINELGKIENLLLKTSSFLDRIEEVGFITEKQAKDFGLTGPIARASGYVLDLRKILPYSGYENFEFNSVFEKEGDGFARMRVFINEIGESFKILTQVLERLKNGEILTDFKIKEGRTISWVEAPKGMGFYYLKINSKGIIERLKIIPPSFSNWHGFHLAVENFAFQDFPIILAGMGLSVAENDR